MPKNKARAIREGCMHGTNPYCGKPFKNEILPIWYKGAHLGEAIVKGDSGWETSRGR